MQGAEQIKRFKEFIESIYKAKLLKKIRKGEKFLVIDFSELLKFSHELADELLEHPEEVIKAGELAIQEFDLPENMGNFRMRFKNLPETQKIMIRNIRSEHIGKLLVMNGVVRQKSDVRPQVTAARFECPNCGNIINVLQLDTQFKEPTRCGCGRKGKFRLLSKELVDAQGLVLEEAPENLEGGEQPKRMNVFLKDDLVSPMSEKRTNPGSKILVIGQIKEIPIITRQGTKSTRFDLMIEANYVEGAEESFHEIEITEEEEKQIKELALDPKIYKKLIDSVAPSIYGHDKIKEALILQMMSGVHKERADGVQTRGDMHILLVGDPGAGKSALLKRISLIAPKGRYISGKGISAAGLTASVVKDEFLRGWSLEAGAMVLASNGICCIDEMDKMSTEDRSAMHEALENQSYHPATEILFSDGTTRKIGPFIDKYFEKNKNKIIKGINCEIIKVNNIELLTTDFKRIFPAKAAMISRHTAPEYFIKINYDNGRSIIVTPEHPVYAFEDGKFKEIAAEKIKENILAPAPRELPTKPASSRLIKEELTHFNNKKINFPEYLNREFSRLLGYLITEGHTYYNPNTRYAEVGISNTGKRIAGEAAYLFRNVFDTTININTRKAQFTEKATLDLETIRCCSIPLYKFLKNNFYEFLNKAPKKRISNNIKSAEKEYQKEFLRTAFKGDGFIDSKRFGFATASYTLAKDYQDLLLQNNILSKIDTEKRKDKKYYKVTATGIESMYNFYNKIVEKDDIRTKRIKRFCKISKNKLNQRDNLPLDLIKEVNRLLKEFRLSNGYFFTIIKRNQTSNRFVIKKYLTEIKDKLKECEAVLNSNNLKSIRRAFNIHVTSIANELDVSCSTIYNLEKRKSDKLFLVVKSLAKTKLEESKQKLKRLFDFVDSKIRFVKIKSVEKIKNNKVKWVYDVTVEPTRTFISEGLVLHNTVSISKANIQATLLARTTVLAAANPKFGRFDPYDIIAKQIDLPPALINRFDLIFPIKDLPDLAIDEKMASHILNLHQTPDIKEPEIPTTLLRKYIAYAKQNIKPVLTDSALEEIKNFYVEMRNKETTEEGAARVIPISPRQLEALVRLAEASAKVRLSDKVTKKDTRRAIELLQHCLSQVGLDPETGKIDIDRIATGVSASARNKILTIKEIIEDLENRIGKTIPIDDLVKEATAQGISESDIEEAITKLTRSGDLFSPRRGFISRI
jgi:replicative DNA helicase Mcm